MNICHIISTASILCVFDNDCVEFMLNTLRCHHDFFIMNSYILLFYW